MSAAGQRALSGGLASPINRAGVGLQIEIESRGRLAVYSIPPCLLPVSITASDPPRLPTSDGP